MRIVVNLDVMMARRHKGAGELAEEIGITPAQYRMFYAEGNGGSETP